MRETQAAAAGWGNGSLALPPGDGGATDWCRRRKGIGGGWEWRRRALGELRDTGIGEIDEKPKLPRREKLFSTGRSDARLIQNRPAATDERTRLDVGPAHSRRWVHQRGSMAFSSEGNQW
jgi:hypothetical protein